MALHDEQADILGGPILQRPESSLFALLGQHRFVFKSVTLLGLGLLVWIVCVHGLEYLKKHRELRYRKAMRRKHGIPDSDCRPFAVAYAAAKRAHLEREAQDRKKMTNNYVSDHHPPAVDQRSDAQKDARGLRKRVPETTIRLHDHQLPTEHAIVYDDKHPDVYSLKFSGRYNPHLCRNVAIPEPLRAKRVFIRHTRGKEFAHSCDENEESRKRSFEDESDVEHEIIKKSRLDGEEFIDGNEEADWYAQYSDVQLRQTSRESLHHRLEADYVHTSDQGRSRHINDLHDEDHGPADEAMEAVGEDELTGLKAVVRGKKRDWAEAESSFGGDEDEDVRNGRASHHRKRRTVSQTRVEVPARGRKRDREAESPESEGERGGSETSQWRTQGSSKKKRGKKATSDDLKEVLMEDPCVSRDSLCGDRRIGEEWEADGVQYKVSGKGERLRLTLIKKARHKYHMPEDSQHPDRSAALEIYVETWVTDDQYKQAEGRQELARQEAPRESKPPEVLDSPTKAGKNILWDSVTSSLARRPIRPPVPSGTSTRINPFEQWQLQPTFQGRRVASSSAIVSPVFPGVSDNPTRPGFRSFSKWEKQDREAIAMARIRAKIEEQKKAQSSPQKSAEMSASVTTPELGSKPLSVPIITLTPAPPVAAEAESANPTGENKMNTSTFFAPPPSTNDSTKNTPTAPSSVTPSFSLPSVPTSASTSSTLFLSASVVPSVTCSTIPLPQSSQVPFSTSITASSSTMPTFFGKGTGVASPSASTPLSFVTTQQPSTEGTSKPAPFSFAKPEVSTSSATSSTAIPAPPMTRPQAPIFGSTKVEVSTPPVALTSTVTSESSKTTTPLFSFSGTSSSSSSTTFPTPSMPKGLFAQSSATSTFTPVANATLGATSQLKPTFKFGSTATSAVDGGSTDGGALTSTPPKPTQASASLANAFPSIPARAPTSGNTQVFSFGGTSSSSKVGDGSKLVSSFGGTARSSNSVPIFGGSSMERPTTFGASGEGFKPAFTSSGNIANSKPPSVLGGSTEGSKPVFPFGGFAEVVKPISVFGGGVETSKSSSTTDVSKPNATSENTTAPTVPTFTLGKDDAATNPSRSMGAQTKLTTPFTFGTPSGATGSIFGQSSTPVTSGDPSQSIFGKPVNATPSTFGFGGSGSSGQSSTFTFSKSVAQNQRQEQ